MKKNSFTQQQLAFYKLYQTYRTEPDKYVQIWEFVGEIHIKEFDKWCLMSYTCVHRAFEIFDENPGLIEREKVTGKSGARYYQYRIAPNPSIEKIKDESLLKFYKSIKMKEMSIEHQKNI